MTFAMFPIFCIVILYLIRALEHSLIYFRVEFIEVQICVCKTEEIFFSHFQYLLVKHCWQESFPI